MQPPTTDALLAGIRQLAAAWRPQQTLTGLRLDFGDGLRLVLILPSAPAPPAVADARETEPAADLESNTLRDAIFDELTKAGKPLKPMAIARRLKRPCSGHLRRLLKKMHADEELALDEDGNYLIAE